MKRYSFKTILTVLAAMLLSISFLVGSVCAEAVSESGKMTFTEWKDRLLNVQSFKFQQHKSGIGFGDCPVYTAPSEKALRFANNRQACDTNAELYEAGRTEDGWLLVRYETGNGKIRVGYIPPKYIKGFKSGMSIKNFDDLSAVAAGAIQVTDNPIKNGTPFATLPAGENFRILAKYTYHGNWWYIECTVDGKTARGFIDRNQSAFLPGNDVDSQPGQSPVQLQTIGAPSKSPAGSGQSGQIRIKGNAGDERKRVHQSADPNSKWVSVVYPTRTYPCYGSAAGTAGSIWYYIFVEEDSAWGWVASELAVLEE